MPEPVAPIAATPDGSYLFSGSCLTGRVYAFSLPSGDLYGSFQAHRQPISCLAIDKDSTWLISAAEDGTIAVFPVLRLLDVSSDRHDSAQLALHQFAAHSSAVTCIAFGPGGCSTSFIASSSLDGTCKFWSIANGADLLQTVRFSCPMWCITVDATNSSAYAGGADGQVYAVPMKRRRRREEVEVVAWQAERRTGPVTAVAMANDGKNLVSASEEGMIRIWDVESGSVVRAFGHERDGTVSGLLVASGFGGCRMIDDKFAGCNVTSGRGFCERHIDRKSSRDVEEREECLLGVVAEDRKRAIDMLEISIETYEKLLGILLREAKNGGG